MLAVTVPPDVAQSMAHSGLDSSAVLLATSTDIALDGESVECWLVVLEKQVLVYALRPVSDQKIVTQIFQVDVSRIEAVRTWAGVGSGILQLKIDQHWIDLLRYSNRYADRFHHVSRKLEQLKNDGKLELHADEQTEAPRCPKCGLRLQELGSTCPRCFHRRQIMHRVWELLRPQLGGTALLCVLTIIGVMAELVPPKLQQYLVDDVLTLHRHDPQHINFFSALFVVVMALAGSRVLLSIVGVFKGQLATRIGSQITYLLRAQMVNRLQNLAIAYYDKHQVGSLISRVAYDSEAIQGLVHQITGGFLLQILQLFGVGAMLLALNWKLAFYTMIPVPLVVLGTWYFWKYVYPRHFRLWDSSSKQIAALSGMLSGIRVVKAFTQEQREFERFQEASRYLRDSRLWVEQANSVYGATMQLVFSLGGLIVWYVGGQDVIGDKMTLGELIAFLAYLAMFYAPLTTLSSFTSWLSSFMTGSKRILEVLDTPLTILQNENPVPWDNVRGEITFEHVTFGYDRHQPVLHDVSFTVKPGEMVGIVGRSGSGKSTLVNLLGRFYDVQEGRILIDGIEVRKMTLMQLRENLGIVLQESFMFRGNIWDNLVYGRPQTSIVEGLATARAAGAHDFICRSPLGYETPLGEQGSGLSGGEKQRLSIARTLLYNPKILVLDEATSNIDAEAERTIQKALEVLIKGRTTVAIAHRLSTLRNADRILVFDRGRLIEEGSHMQLLEKDGTYAKLVKIQTQISKDSHIDKLITLPVEGEPAKVEATESEVKVADEEKKINTNELTHTGSSEKTVQIKDPPPVETDAPRDLSQLLLQMNWLSPAQTQLKIGELGELMCTMPKRETEPTSGVETLTVDSSTEVSAFMTHHSVFAICAFPATYPDQFISLRGWNEQGDETEIGMIQNLAEWPVETQSLIRQSIRKRYLFRKITAIHDMNLAQGYLEFEVDTDFGFQRFLMRWSHSHAVEFGLHGKLIIDTEDNRYYISDLKQLSRADREMFLRYIYW
jgi:ATP-binding cassette subfamily B protein